MLSIVVLAWDNLPLTRACVESLRRTTDVEHELIVVDNGSGHEAASWASANADVAVLHDTNEGFARGMNAGLAAASGALVAFVNNDTVWPDGWTGPLLEHFSDDDGRTGIVAPAVTAAGNPVTVRERPGDEVVVLDPFAALPSGVVYVMRTATARAIGGWTERYDLAMSEDLDLCFTAWSNGLDVIVDTRVLVEHVLHGTLDAMASGARSELWRANLDRFLSFWTTTTGEGVGRLPSTTDEALAANLRHARAAATWLRRLDEARRAAEDERLRLRGRIEKLEGDVAVLRHRLDEARDRGLLERTWRRLTS